MENKEKTVSHACLTEFLAYMCDIFKPSNKARYKGELYQTYAPLFELPSFVEFVTDSKNFNEVAELENFRLENNLFDKYGKLNTCEYDFWIYRSFFLYADYKLKAFNNSEQGKMKIVPFLTSALRNALLKIQKDRPEFIDQNTHVIAETITVLEGVS